MYNRWRTIRVLLVCAFAVAGFAMSRPVLPAPIWLPFVGALVGGGMISLWVRPMYRRMFPETLWDAPSWHRAPLNIQRPLEFFRLFAVGAIAISVGAAVAAVVYTLPIDGGLFLPAGFGFGMLLEIWRGSRMKPNNSFERTRDR